MDCVRLEHGRLERDVAFRDADDGFVQTIVDGGEGDIGSIGNLAESGCLESFGLACAPDRFGVREGLQRPGGAQQAPSDQ